MAAQLQGTPDTDGHWLTMPRTLCFIFNGDDVLLMKRAAHKRIFPNRYNGIGGHIERNEDVFSGMKREVKEETGLLVQDLGLCAVYNIDAGGNVGVMLFVFTAISESREVTANSEGTLHWIPRDEVLNFDLVEDLPEVLPRILRMRPGNAPLFIHASYDSANQLLLRFAQN